MRAVIYSRISRDPEGTELGVQRQERECRALCEREGHTVVDVLVDNDISAYRGAPRPGWQEVQEAVKAGRVDVLVAWHPDRLTRHLRELEDLIDLLDATGTKVRTVQSGEYDLSTPSGRMNARIVGAVARGESDRKSQRLRSKALQLAQSGKVGGGGTRPFGFEADRVTIREDEAEAIRWAAAEVIAGSSLRSVARRMSLPTPSGNEWTPTSLRRVLIGPRWAGLREHRGEVVGEAVWDAVLDRETWTRVSNVLSDPRRRTKRVPTKYLLTGLATDRYDRPLIARPNSRGVRCYISTPEPGCPGVRIGADDLDRIVLDTCRQLLVEGAELAPAPSDDSDTLDAIAEAEDEAARLLQLRQDNTITLDEYLALRAGPHDRLEALRASLGPVQRPLDPESVLARWEGLEIEEHRRVIERLLARIVVLPAERGKHTPPAERVYTEIRRERDVVPAELR